MKKYKIFYIDDQSFALPQLIKAIPIFIDYELIYVQRIQDIQEIDYDLVVLDFYLDKDSKTAIDIIEKFRDMKILSFSTCSEKNKMMREAYGVHYSVKKLKNTNSNLELEKTMKEIFSLT